MAVLAVMTLTLTSITGLAFIRYRVHLYAWWLGFPMPKHRVVTEKNVMVRSHDGVGLATDIYRPKTPGKYPVLLARTPYNKNDRETHPPQMALMFASQGYVFLLQDVRGKHNSGGRFEPYLNESIDGHTTVEWAGKAPWSNGKVVLFGFSYLGSCVWLAAKYKSPYLKAIIPMFSSRNAYSIWMDKGVLFLKGNLYWISKYYKKRDSKVTHRKIERLLWKLPVSSLDALAVGRKIKTYQDFIDHTMPGEFWEKRSFGPVDSLDLPAFFVSGWFDPFVDSTIKDFQDMQASPPGSLNRGSQLLLGPWAHNPLQTFKGISFGKQGYFPYQLSSRLSWLNKWLKHELPPKEHIFRVKYFVMGKNEWKEADQWPPPGIRHTKYYLKCSGGHHQKNERLSISPRLPSTAHEICYTYDPRNPVPFRGSRLLHEHIWTGPVDQKEILRRDDVLTFRTDPLKKEIALAGTVRLILFAASSAIDTDFCVKICDERPDGKSYSIQTGIIRTRYRDSLTDPKMMEPGKVYQLDILFRATAHAFLKNHRLQLQVTSSNFPSYDRNLNTGKSCEHTSQTLTARQTIYTGGDYPSHLILPVLPADSGAAAF